MSSWDKISGELNRKAENGVKNFDQVRRKYLRILSQHTKRNVILYGSSWLQKRDADSASLSMIDEKDVMALRECVNGLRGDKLDLILHSPGGFAESAEHIVEYLRSHFSDVRVIVPYLAMSAATLIACSANEILLGPQSALGPIDPQISLPVEKGVRTVAAQDVLEQFAYTLDVAKTEGIEVAYPMFSPFGPDLIIRSNRSVVLNTQLAENWLVKYMFSGDEDGAARAKSIADWLISREDSMSHSRCLLASQLKEKGLKIGDLEADRKVNEAVMSAFYALQQTFEETFAVKVVENHEGKALISGRNPGVPNLDIRVEPQVPNESN